MEIQDAYKQKMAAQLKEWAAQINLLEAKVENVSVDIKIMRARQLVELRARQSAAYEKMRELEKVSGEAWNQVKVTADKILDDLKVGIADVQSKFK
ncbi:MAG: hypothetical protein ABL858_00815 [Candidatus Nitrotoga sp.]